MHTRIVDGRNATVLDHTELLPAQAFSPRPSGRLFCAAAAVESQTGRVLARDRRQDGASVSKTGSPVHRRWHGPMTWPTARVSIQSMTRRVKTIISVGVQCWSRSARSVLARKRRSSKRKRVRRRRQPSRRRLRTRAPIPRPPPSVTGSCAARLNWRSAGSRRISRSISRRCCQPTSRFRAPCESRLDEKDEQPVSVPWTRCLPSGCFASLAMTDPVLKRWREHDRRRPLDVQGRQRTGHDRPDVVPWPSRERLMRSAKTETGTSYPVPLRLFRDRNSLGARTLRARNWMFVMTFACRDVESPRWRRNPHRLTNATF